MAIPVEQFTAPGKYYYDLAMERLQRELKDESKLYTGLRNQPKTNCVFKNNLYYNYKGSIKK